MRASVVVPAFDEAATLGRVVAAARAHAPVIVVDDGSTDASAAVAAAAGAAVLRHARRRGKAEALRTGIAAARARGATHVATLDGDGQHDPDDLPALLAAARAAPDALVIGDRLGAGTIPRERLNAIRVAGFFVAWAGGLAVRDTQSGFRVYPVAVLDAVRPRRQGFVFETETLLAVAARGGPVREVRIAAPRAARRSRFRPLLDGWAVGAFLGRRVLARWALEARAAAREVGAVFSGARRRARHAAMLAEAAPWSDSLGTWSSAVGAIAARRAGSRLGGWWRHPRRRRAAVAAGATLALPVALPLLLLQALAGRWLPDVVTPLVTTLYATERLAPDDAAAPLVGAGLAAPPAPP